MIGAPLISAIHCTRAFPPSMLQRKSGHIVNITSVAGFFNWPGATVYSAARWGMRGFTEALSADLHGTGVKVTLAVFAKVQSGYWANNPGSEDRVLGAQAMIRSLSTDEAARMILNGIERNKRLVMATWMLRLILWQHRFVPFINAWLMRKTGHKRSESG